MQPLYLDDYLVALQLHLSLTGAGHFEIQTLNQILDVSDGPRPDDADYLLDLTTTSNLHAHTRLITNDSHFAKSVALAHAGLPPVDKPSNAVTISATRAVAHEWKGMQCLICFEYAMPSFCYVVGECGHAFCVGCMTRYLGESVARGRWPIRCPQCGQGLRIEDCFRLLAGTGVLLQRFEAQVVMKGFVSRLRYCANERCGVAFDWVVVGGSSSQGVVRVGEERVLCPLCYEETCVRCRTKWHHGKSCREFEAEMVKGAAQGRVWKQCPRCGHLIEKRIGDCNHVRCLCGCRFCSRCGKEYKSHVGSAENHHGTAACQCSLFS